MIDFLLTYAVPPVVFALAAMLWVFVGSLVYHALDLLLGGALREILEEDDALGVIGCMLWPLVTTICLLRLGGELLLWSVNLGRRLFMRRAKKKVDLPVAKVVQS